MNAITPENKNIDQLRDSLKTMLKEKKEYKSSPESLERMNEPMGLDIVIEKEKFSKNEPENKK